MTIYDWVLTFLKHISTDILDVRQYYTMVSHLKDVCCV